MAITLQTIESLPLVEEVNENTSLVGWDGEKTVRVASDMVGGSGLPEGGEPHKQLVTDGEGKTVWEERLAYERFTKGASLEPREYDFNEDHGLNLFVLPDFHPTVNDGDVLQMFFDGQNYTFTLTWNDQFNSFAFGNVAKMEGNGDTGEPFVGTLDSENGFVLATFDSATNHTVGIELNNKTIHKIPSKYIPNIVVKYDGIKYSCNVDYDQFYDQVFSGIPIVYISTDSGTQRYEPLVRVRCDGVKGDDIYITAYGEYLSDYPSPNTRLVYSATEGLFELPPLE